MHRQSEKRGALLKAKKSAYDWLVKNSAPNTRVIAYEDLSVYLYSGRMAMRPIFFSTAEQFDSARLTQALSHLGDVPQAIGADYWIAATDDFQNEWPSAGAGAQQFVNGLGGKVPAVYSNPDYSVRIYSIQCFQREPFGCQQGMTQLPKYVEQNDEHAPIN